VRQAQDWAALVQRMKELEQRQEQGASQAEAERIILLEYQKRFEAQDQLLQLLTSQLQAETEERKRLSEYLTAQQEQLLKLTDESHP
jgi:hypothetical protein